MSDDASKSGGSSRVPRGLIGHRLEADGVAFRVWAPSRRSVDVVVTDRPELALARAPDGYFEGFGSGLGVGTRYRFRLDGEDASYPDPAARNQPDGPHGASCVVDPDSYRWTDAGWPGLTLPGQVIYELHVGTFTPEGTWRAAAGKLPYLKDVGITCIEMMPVATFGGRFGWGYDGVDLFAPHPAYGEPDDLKCFVDAAHAVGIGVILDVVYNHLGPDGNYLAAFSRDYFSTRHSTDWGEAINFDGQRNAPVRDFFLANARYWIEEFHFDGLRLDATQSMLDDSPDHIIAAIAREARLAAGSRSILMIGENEPQHCDLVRRPEEGGLGLDALWNDDFHHSAMVAVTGRAEGYYQDYRGAPQEFIAAAKFGYLFQGQFYGHQSKRRGTPSWGIAPAAFVTFIQNHDQVANSLAGRRLSEVTSPAQARAMTALMLLIPATPMLFQGQEFGASSPFLYFADHEPELAKLVCAGRAGSLDQFESFEADPAARAAMPDPADEATFARCRLDWQEAERNASILALHRDLLALRRSDEVVSRQASGAIDGAVLAGGAFVLRMSGAERGDRLILVNLGASLMRRSFPEPLLAPPSGNRWTLAWSSEHPKYGGGGTPAIEAQSGWHLPGHATILLKSENIPPLPEFV